MAGSVADWPNLVGVLRRRTPPAAETQSAEETAATTAAQPPGAAGKGRPTPKRREAEQARKERVRPTTNRREAIRRERERARAERARTRQAMSTGDERYFLKRDQGPVRKFIRDYVDSRRTIAEFFLPIILVVLVTSLIGIPEVQFVSTLVWAVAMIVLVVDLTVIGWRVKREVRKRFPDDPGKGNALYAVARATQIRRFRLPKPTVKPGTLV